MTAPRNLLDPNRHSQFGKGRLAWAVPARFSAMSMENQDLMLWDVRGALLQHEFALGLNRALWSKPRQTRLDFSDQWHYSEDRLARVMRGQAHVSSTEVALALRALGPSALPAPSVAQASVRRAGQSVRHIPGLKPGVILRADGIEPPETTPDQEAVMAALGEMGGVTVLPELTPEQEAAYARNAELAKPLVTAAVKRLRNRPEVLDDRWDPDGDQNDIWIEAAYEMAGGRPLPVGGPDNKGNALTLYLAADWGTRVHDAGLAVVDIWFVLDVGGYGPDGRPTTAVVLDLAPEHGVWARDEKGRLTEDDWEHVGRTARVRWDAQGTPSIEN